MEKKENKTKKDTKPFHTIRHGAIAANIWERQSQTGFTYYEYSLSRSWKSSNSAKQGYSQNYYTRNREQLVLCVEDATKYIDGLMADAEGNSETTVETGQPAFAQADEAFHPVA